MFMKAPDIANRLTQRFKYVCIYVRGDPAQFLRANLKLGGLHGAAIELLCIIDYRRIAAHANPVNDRSNLFHQIGVEDDVTLPDALQLRRPSFLVVTANDFNHRSLASIGLLREI